MIKEDGYIVYTLPGSPKEYTKDVIYIKHMGKDLEVFTDTRITINPPSVFYYSGSLKKWLVPAENYEETEDWEVFAGAVLAFSYTTQMCQEA